MGSPVREPCGTSDLRKRHLADLGASAARSAQRLSGFHLRGLYVPGSLCWYRCPITRSRSPSVPVPQRAKNGKPETEGSRESGAARQRGICWRGTDAGLEHHLGREPEASEDQGPGTRGRRTSLLQPAVGQRQHCPQNNYLSPFLPITCPRAHESEHGGQRGPRPSGN